MSGLSMRAFTASGFPASLILSLALTVLPVIGGQCANSQVSSEYNRATLVFKLTVSNPGSSPRAITKVGLSSQARGVPVGFFAACRQVETRVSLQITQLNFTSVRQKRLQTQIRC